MYKIKGMPMCAKVGTRGTKWLGLVPVLAYIQLLASKRTVWKQ